MRPRNYILNGKIPVPCSDLLEWGRKFQEADARVALEKIPNIEPWKSKDIERVKESRLRYYKLFGHVGPSYEINDANTITISTVFLGLDHSHYEAGPPILFETMIFNGPLHEYQERYCTWDEAELGHKVAVELVKKALGEKEETGNGA